MFEKRRRRVWPLYSHVYNTYSRRYLKVTVIIKVFARRPTTHSSRKPFVPAGVLRRKVKNRLIERIFGKGVAWIERVQQWSGRARYIFRIARRRWR